MKLRVLIGYNYILHYRLPLFNRLAERYDLTVLHSGKQMRGREEKFTEIIVPVYKVGPLHMQPDFIRESKSTKYDVVIALFDVAWISTLISFLIRNKNKKYILWGAWITGSRLANMLRLRLTKMANANIFYTHEARHDFENRGIVKEKMYVANNTFDVGEQIQSYLNPIKDCILFVGSLDKRKQLDVLGIAFKRIIPEIPENIKLLIIGDGRERDNIVTFYESLKIGDRVEIIGAINNNELLRDYYRRAIASVSFGQAGLSVLQSLGYGVPFITKKNAISGGEITNIKHLKNGILCEDSTDDLAIYLTKVCNDLAFARELGLNAFNYYKLYCSMDNMAQGFIDAIEGSRLARVDES